MARHQTARGAVGTRSANAGANALLVAALLLVGWATLVPHGTTVVSEAPHLCIWCGASRVTDAIANVALFLPLGIALVLRGARVPGSAALGALVSLCIEGAQFAGFPPGRVASLADVLTNAAGASVGAWLAWRRDDVVFPDARLARQLASAWSLVVAAVLLASAWAVSAPPRLVSSPVEPPRESALPFAPGFGWFVGTVTHAVVNGVDIPHGGSGPVIVAMPVGERIAADIDVAGRDLRRTIVPMLYVHELADSTPALMIAQRGESVLLRADSRGARIGLVALDAELPLARVEQARTGTTSDSTPPDARHLRVRVTTRELTFGMIDRTGVASMVLPRTATTGWALAQSVVSRSSEWRGVLTILWLTALLLPLGYWGWRSGAARAYVTIMGSLLTCGAIAVGVRMFALSYPPRSEWFALAGALGAGMALSQLSPAFHGSTHSRVTDA